jgi:hypothetical protein
VPRRAVLAEHEFALAARLIATGHDGALGVPGALVERGQAGELLDVRVVLESPRQGHGSASEISPRLEDV